MVVCSSCGVRNDAGEAACKNCGKPFGGAVKAAQPAQTPQPVGNDPNKIGCDACGLEIAPSTGILQAGNKKYHPNCFTCSVCGKAITAAYGYKNGKPACVTCGGTKRKGFTIDPRTGEKKFMSAKK